MHRYLMIAAMLVAGCEQFKSPQRIRELEDRVDKLSDEVSTLKGSPSAASRNHAGPGDMAGSGEGSEGAGSGEGGEKVAAAAPHEGAGDTGEAKDPAGDKADGEGKDHGDKAAAPEHGDGKDRGEEAAAGDRGDREPPGDRGGGKDRDRDTGSDRAEGKDRDRDTGGDREGKDRAEPGRDHGEGKDRGDHDTSGDHDGKDRGDREAATDRGADNDRGDGEAKSRRDQDPKARALDDLRRIVSDATRASKGEPRAARSGDRAGRSDDTRSGARGKSRDADDKAIDTAEPSHAPAPGGKPPWSYEGKNGPPTWGTLDPEWRACMVGKAQSPIDIEPRAGNASPITFHYRPTAATLHDNGHTLEVAMAPGSSIEIDGTSYRLLQFHFHMPSEHTIAGEHYPLELHLVHQDDDGKLAVIAVMYDAGAESRALGSLWSRWPRAAGGEDRGKKPFDPSELLPETRTVYRYTGSLTTPPCTEGVLWNVMRRAMTDSKAHLDTFARHYSHNARGVQPPNDRKIQ